MTQNLLLKQDFYLLKLTREEDMLGRPILENIRVIEEREGSGEAWAKALVPNHNLLKIHSYVTIDKLVQLQKHSSFHEVQY